MYTMHSIHSRLPCPQWLDCALAALQTLRTSDFAQTADSVPQPYLESPPFSDVPFNLPNVLVPPEPVELDNESGEGPQVKKEEWPKCYIRLFDDDVCSLFDHVTCIDVC